MKNGVALIGCGVIGDRRLEEIHRTGLGEIAGVYDIDSQRAGKLARKYQSSFAPDPLILLDDDKIAVVIVATTNGKLAEYGQVALSRGKHVLLEKPGAISIEQVRELTRLTKTADQPLFCKIGYNHRFHPAAIRIHEELQSREHGPILWVRGAYGHGGRPGYEKEWRFHKEISGGGEIIDQGVHLLDLTRWWVGEPMRLAAGFRQNAFYRSAVEDNGFLNLTFPSGVHAHLHCSVTQWKNLFRVEIATTKALFIWEGLGNRNYGDEVLTVFTRKQEGGRPERVEIRFEPSAIQSWEQEWRHLWSCIQGERPQLWSSVEESEEIFQIIAALEERDTVRREW